MSRIFLLSLLCLLLAVSVSADATLVGWTTQTTSPGFTNREYAYCAQSPASKNATQTLYLWGGFAPVLANASYSDTYYNDGWSSTNAGASWSNVAPSSTSGLPAAAWGGAAVLSNGNILLVSGGQDSTQFNTVYISTNGGQSFTTATQGPFEPRENFGFAVQPGTNNVLLALGGTNDQYIDDIWYNNDGTGQNWARTCYGNSSTSSNPCPLLITVGSNTTGEVHGPALVGFYDQRTWVLIGGYDTNAAGTTYVVTNQVAYSTNNFQTYATYQAPFLPRGQARAVVDTDNYIYVFGGVYDIPPKSAWQYYNDLWISTNAASSTAVRTQISASGISAVTYGSASYTAVFNPCLAFIWQSGQKTLVSYSGVYGYYAQNAVAPQYPAVYQGAVTFSSSSTGGGYSSSTGGGYTSSSSSTGNGAVSSMNGNMGLISVSMLVAAVLALFL